jgi:hypothetical protein
MGTLQEWRGRKHISTTERYADYAPRASEGVMISQAFARRDRQHGRWRQHRQGRWSQADHVVVVRTMDLG